jgi:hypothetical protein
MADRRETVKGMPGNIVESLKEKIDDGQHGT